MQVRVLIVEDELNTIKLLSDFLTNYDTIKFTVLQATTISSALSQIESEQLDIIILDLHLPESGWTNTLTKVRDILKDRPVKPMVIAITGDDGIRWVDVKDFNVTDLVYKPFDFFIFIQHAMVLTALNSFNYSLRNKAEVTNQGRELIKKFYAKFY
jgi:DNA-binding response OmpR family regulator